MLGHVGSRGLIWLAIHGAPGLAAFAITGFAVVDGLAIYGTIQKWVGLEQRTWRWFYGIVTGVSLLEFSAFILFAILLDDTN